MPLVTLAAGLAARTRALPPLARHAVTVAIVLGVFLVRRAADPVLGDDYPFLLFFVAVLLAAALFDHWAGLLATALSALLVAYFYLPPIGRLDLNSRQLLALSAFVAIGAVMALVVETLHNAVARLEQTVAELRRSERIRALLMQEFRHRIRNDLGALVGLLTLRARAAPSEAAREGLLDAAGHAMALARVHGRLALAEEGFGADGRAAVDTREFVAGLCADIEAAQFGEGLRPVALVVEAEAHPLQAERAVPLGLVLNEAVTNALK
jgi:K+-sensing histidine kinase KdpD